MKKLLRTTSLSFLAMGFLLSSCEKYGILDNSNTIKVPFTMYLGDVNGNMYKTNNDKVQDIFHFGGGSITQSVWVLDTNVLFLNNKVNMGNGLLPTTAFDHQVENSFTVFNGNQPSQIHRKVYINTACWDPAQKLMYVCANGASPIRQNIALGKVGAWTISPFVAPPGACFSVTRLDNGDVYCNDQTNTTKVFKRTGGINAFAVVNFAAPDTPRKTGSPINPSYHLAKQNNRLLLIENNGINQSYYSDNGGANWKKLTGLPLGKKVLMSKQIEYNNNFYCSVDSIGMYRLDGTNFVKDDGGIPSHTRIWDIVGRRNIYRTGEAKYYYYLATSQGLYKSDNGAKDWVKIDDREFTALY